MSISLLLLLAAAKAPPPAASDPSWIHKPTSQELRAIWPASAQAGGWADLHCDLSREGRPSNCDIQMEYPQGSGFGAAALRLVGGIHEMPAVHGNRVEDDTELALKFVVGPNGERSVDFAKTEPPAWLRKPTVQELRAVYPVEAYKKGESGTATISCEVNVYGRLIDCVTDSEDPPGNEFGAAALALTPQFLMKPRRVEGTPVRSSVRIPIFFKTFGRGSSDTLNIAPVSIAWVKAPSVADLRAAYPEKARAEKRGGNASVLCTIDKAGQLQDCSVITETPAGLGFGAAARKLARQFQAPLTTASGQAMAKAQVTVPISFAPETLDAATPIIGKPLWAKLPSAEDFNKAYSGIHTTAATLRATLSCMVEQGGGVSGCTIVREEPAGSGFGEHALQLAPAFKLSTWTDAGLPVIGARVSIPLRFDIKDAPAQPPAKP